jgi:hypothetical protein
MRGKLEVYMRGCAPPRSLWAARALLPSRSPHGLWRDKSGFPTDTFDTNPLSSNFTARRNQITPESAGKLGSVEGDA